MRQKYVTGNIDVHNRPMYRQPNGDISTVNSMSFNDNGAEVLVPTVDYDSQGTFRQLSDDEAIQKYRDTGQFLGKFPDIDSADTYATRLHNDLETELLYKLALDSLQRKAPGRSFN